MTQSQSIAASAVSEITPAGADSQGVVVCFGYVNPGLIFSVDKYPAANAGAYVSHKQPFIGADCTMAARTLARWGVPTHLIGNALGADAAGRTTLEQLQAEHVRTHIAVRPNLRTPEEVDVIDRAGTRTFFVESTPVWNTLMEADLSAIEHAAMLYVDWYVGEPAHLAVARARLHHVPVFLNVEYSLREPQKYFEMVSQATYVQSPLSDSAEFYEDPCALAQAICAAGPKMAFVTQGRHGALALQDGPCIQVPATPVDVLDAQGAGATFSAAAMYGLLQGWSVEAVAEFATRAASLKCAKFGLIDLTVEQVLGEGG